MAKGDTRRDFPSPGTPQYSPGGFRPPSSPFGVPRKPNDVGLSFKEAYPAAVGQTGEDYSAIMKGYQDILKNAPLNRASLFQNYGGGTGGGNGTGTSLAAPIAPAPISFAPVSAVDVPAPERVTPQNYDYTQSGDVTASLAGLAELAQTGGYSEEGIRDLRARGVSPIRAVYANAMRNLDRNRALQGGYGSNYNAAAARMARELSEQVAGQTTKVNADIADAVAKGRLTAAPAYAGYAGAESARRTGAEQANIEAANRAAEINAAAGNRFLEFGASEKSKVNELNAMREAEATKTNLATRSDYDRLRAEYDKMRLGDAEARRKEMLGLSEPTAELAALQGMTSLYGTTPALASTFGNQALNAAELEARAPARPAGVGGLQVNAGIPRPGTRIPPQYYQSPYYRRAA